MSEVANIVTEAFEKQDELLDELLNSDMSAMEYLTRSNEIHAEYRAKVLAVIVSGQTWRKDDIIETP